MSKFETRSDHILSAALEVVSDGGFRNLQMLSVAASAGLSVGAIYRYYTSKASLCAALVAKVSAGELAVLQAIAASEAPAPVRLADGVKAFVRRALQNRQLAYAMIAEPVDEAVDAERLLWRGHISRVFEGIIAEGVADESLRDTPPDLAASCVVGAFMEALIGPLSPEKPAEGGWESYVEVISEFCLAAVLSRSEAPATLFPDEKTAQRYCLQSTQTERNT
jgi:AcrR family transcriptional regulator